MAVSKDTVTYAPRVLHFSAFHFVLFSKYNEHFLKPYQGEHVEHGQFVLKNELI